jgi:hypothetical protein
MKKTISILMILGLLLAFPICSFAQDNETGCTLTVTPSEITVEGGNDKTLDVVISATGGAAIGTDLDIEAVEVILDDICQEFITINSYAVGTTNNEITANITVGGDADSVTCSALFTFDGASEPCEASFTILTSEEEPQEDECGLLSISRDSVKTGILIPSFALLFITGSRDCEFDRSSEVDFGTDDIKTQVLFAFKNTVAAIVIINAVTEPGLYDVTVDGHGGVDFEVL